MNDKNISSTEVSIDTFFHNTESHNAIKGKKIFTKKLRKPCDISAADFSGVHTQDEWEAITEAGTLKDEILQICPEIEGKIKQQWLPSLYQFLYEYASDSGNIPSCSD
ncbi:MAG: cytochrome C [Epsilonproteobacteria bacterium]|nr:cytochrome C [Campylobacterota bacterium]